MPRKAFWHFMLSAAVACAHGVPPLASSPASFEIPPPAPLIVRQTDSAGVITGVVRDDSGRVKPYALLKVNGDAQRVAVDSLGRFRFVAGAGPVMLETLGLGSFSRRDSLRVVSGNGLALEITLRSAAASLGNVCACDPGPTLLTLQFRRPTNRPLRFLIVTILERGRFPVRDSIAGAEFNDDTLSHETLWAFGDEPTHRSVSVTVDSPGYYPWRRGRVELPGRVEVVLKPLP
jgi:hypothetical protein